MEKSPAEHDLQVEILREYRSLQENTRERNPNTRDDRIRVIKRKLCQRIVSGLPRVRRFAGNNNNNNNGADTDSSQTLNGDNNNETTSPAATENQETDTNQDSQVARLPPSYSEIVDEGLPDYKQI